MKRPVTLLFILVYMAAPSCRRKCTFNCQQSNFGIQVKGFTDTEVDTIEINCYTANGKFNDLVSRTFAYDVLYHGLGRYESYYDWEFYIPATKTSYRFSEITYEGKTSVEADCKTTRGCINSVSSFRLNGNTVNNSFGEIVK